MKGDIPRHHLNPVDANISGDPAESANQGVLGHGSLRVCLIPEDKTCAVMVEELEEVHRPSDWRWEGNLAARAELRGPLRPSSSVT